MIHQYSRTSSAHSARWTASHGLPPVRSTRRSRARDMPTNSVRSCNAIRSDRWSPSRSGEEPARRPFGRSEAGDQNLLELQSLGAVEGSDKNTFGVVTLVAIQPVGRDARAVERLHHVVAFALDLNENCHVTRVDPVRTRSLTSSLSSSSSSAGDRSTCSSAGSPTVSGSGSSPVGPTRRPRRGRRTPGLPSRRGRQSRRTRCFANSRSELETYRRCRLRSRAARSHPDRSTAGRRRRSGGVDGFALVERQEQAHSYRAEVLGLIDDDPVVPGRRRPRRARAP